MYLEFWAMTVFLGLIVIGIVTHIRYRPKVAWAFIRFADRIGARYYNDMGYCNYVDYAKCAEDMGFKQKDIDFLRAGGRATYYRDMEPLYNPFAANPQ